MAAKSSHAGSEPFLPPPFRPAAFLPVPFPGLRAGTCVTLLELNTLSFQRLTRDVPDAPLGALSVREALLGSGGITVEVADRLFVNVSTSA